MESTAQYWGSLYGKHWSNFGRRKFAMNPLPAPVVPGNARFRALPECARRVLITIKQDAIKTKAEPQPKPKKAATR